jgi:hypothetical protein
VGDPASFYTNWGGMRSISTNIIGQVNPQQLLLSNGEIKGSGWFIISYDWSVYILLLLLTVMSFFFNLFLVYIFGSIAFLFFTRTIGLYLGVITSPIAFVSWTVPALQKMNFIGFDDWAKQFFGLAFMAPVFLFFLYIIVQFFDISFISGGSGYLVLGAQIAIKLAIIGVLLIYSRKIAKDLSGKIGDAAGGIITGIAGAGAMFAGAALTGGAGGMLAMGKQMAKNTWSSAKTTAVSTVGKATFGEEKYAAMEQRWKINGKALSFENLRKNPRSVFNAATKIASAGGEPGVFAAWRAGRAAPRKFDIEQAKKRKEEYEKKEKYNKAWEPYTSPDGAQRRKRLKEIEKELENHKKDLDENIITRQEYKDKAKALNQEKRIQSIGREVKRGDKEAVAEDAALRKIETGLKEGKRARSVLLTDEEKAKIKQLGLISMKPILYVLNKKHGGQNLDELKDARYQKLLEFLKSEGAEYVVVDAKIQDELAAFEGEERVMMRSEMGVTSDGVDDLIRGAYHLLGLETYFTTGEDETRAWTIKVGSTAPEAGTAIHTDFKDKFVRAEIIHWKTLLDAGSFATAREKGLVRTEGKEYIVKDGDVIEFKI